MALKELNWSEAELQSVFSDRTPLYFEDFIEGEIYQYKKSHKVTQQDCIAHSLTSFGVVNLGTLDASAPLNACSISSLVTFSIVADLSLNPIQTRSLESHSWKNVSVQAPVFVGDTLFVQTKVLDKSRSRIYPHQGIVTVETTGINQDGAVCLVWEQGFLMPCGVSNRE